MTLSDFKLHCLYGHHALIPHGHNIMKISNYPLLIVLGFCLINPLVEIKVTNIVNNPVQHKHWMSQNCLIQTVWKFEVRVSGHIGC